MGVTAMGKKYYVHSNKNNNIFVPELEKIIGKKVVSLKISHVVGSGCKEYFPVKNYIDCPDLGWPEMNFRSLRKSTSTTWVRGVQTRMDQVKGGSEMVDQCFHLMLLDQEFVLPEFLNSNHIFEFCLLLIMYYVP